MSYIIDGHNLIGVMPDIHLRQPDDEERLVARLQSYQARMGEACMDRGPGHLVTRKGRDRVQVLLWNRTTQPLSAPASGDEARGEPPKIFSDLEKLEYQPSSLTAEQIAAVGRRFDDIVDEDAPVHVYFEDRAKIDASGDPRKISFLQKIPRNVDRLRIVDIGTYASTFCFGTHVKNTAEIGKVRVAKIEKKSARTRRVVLEFA